MAEHIHHEGDCLEIMPELPRGKFDLILTDPPYAMPAQYYMQAGTNVRKRWSDTLIFAGWWRTVVDTCLPLLAENSALAVFCNETAAAVMLPPIFERLRRRPHLAVWDKMSVGRGAPIRRQTELILFGFLGVPYCGDRSQGDVFRCPRVPPSKRVHPAQKPTALLETIIELLCPPDGWVLDPFAGSRSLTDAAEQAGRNSVTIEYDPADEEENRARLVPIGGESD